MIMISSSPDIDDDFPNTTLLSDEDIAAILSSTATMFMEENNNNGGEKGEGRSVVMEEDEEEKRKQEQQRVIRKRCRASKHTPSTFLIAKPCDFRALVQQLTGCQSSDSSYKGPINLSFGAAEQHHDDYTTADHLDTPMLAFNFDQNSAQMNNKKKKISNNYENHCRDGGQQRLLYYEEQESSSNSNNSSSVSIHNGTSENTPDNYSMMIKDNYDDNYDDDLLLSMNDDIFVGEYSSLEYGSDQYSSSPGVVAETDHVASNGDYYYSLDYIFLDDDSTTLF